MHLYCIISLQRRPALVGISASIAACLCFFECLCYIVCFEANKYSQSVSQSDYAITTTTIYHDSVLVWEGGRIDRNLIAPDAGAHTRRRATFATSLRARWSARQARMNNVSAQLSTFCRTHDFLTPVNASPACSNSTLPSRAR